MFKTLVQQIDAVAEKSLPLPQPLDEEIVAWADLHGWDAQDAQGQRLLLRQALLNVIIRQVVPEIVDHTFATPLDGLTLEVPPALTDAISEAMQRSQGVFNFWGELYSALIPQSERRRIGQFWTDEQVAEWMVAWLLQSRPRCLVDVGCGAGNFLLKAAECLEQTIHPTRLHGFDVSGVLLNAALAAFLTRRWSSSSVLPTLAVQNYLEAPLPRDVDAVVSNPPYT